MLQSPVLRCPLFKDDLRILLDAKWIYVDKNDYIRWQSFIKASQTSFKFIKKLGDAQCLKYNDGRPLIELYPQNVWNYFSEIYVITEFPEESNIIKMMNDNDIKYETQTRT